MANSTVFRNCLVAMRPTSNAADLPSTHDITTYIHNTFIDSLKQQLQVIICTTTCTYHLAYLNVLHYIIATDHGPCLGNN